MEDAGELGPELCSLARRAILADLRGEVLELSTQTGVRAGVFVTLRERDGSLRGCVGALNPLTSNIAAETARAAVLAASSDPRFSPVAEDELAGLRIEVSVLGPPEPVTDESELDPLVYGVVVTASRGRRALLLPGIPGIEDAREQLRVVRLKGGIEPDAAVAIQRFSVRKFTEPVASASQGVTSAP